MKMEKSLETVSELQCHAFNNYLHCLEEILYGPCMIANAIEIEAIRCEESCVENTKSGLVPTLNILWLS